MLSRIFYSKRTTVAFGVICVILPALLAAYGYFEYNRPPLMLIEDGTVRHFTVRNAHILLGMFFLLAATVPFMLVYDKRKAQARDLIPIAVMAAIGVAGRAAFAIIPIPHFRPLSAVIIIAAIAFGPEAGFITGALAAFVSNFLFGQGPWTPWQMFSWGMIAFIAGVLYNAGFFRGKAGKAYFTNKRWGRICPTGTNRGDLLEFARRVTDHAPMSLCLYGLLTGFLFGWIMNIYFLFGFVSVITWQTIVSIYISSFLFDLSHGVCTFLVLWALAAPWTRKLDRVKVKFGLVGEAKHYTLPPSTKAEGLA